MDYKNTLNLPRTDFAMKAGLVEREPQRLASWTDAGLYDRIREARAGREKFVLHDGPPFANGDVHVGTALNKVLKDIIVKYKTLRGFDAPYVPGWDCHGLPIEFKVTQQMRKDGNGDATAAEIRTACEEYALKYIDIQREQFKRLGVLGEWDNPYLTLRKEYEAEELRLFADIVEQGFVYRGKKPVYWSIPCRTALAEAEVEYQDHVSQSVYVRMRCEGEPNTFVLIWTTTPWTLPANLGIAFNPKLLYSLVMADDAAYLVCDNLMGELAQKCEWQNWHIVRSVEPQELQSIVYEHPFCKRTGKLHPADFVEDSTGTGFVHIAPGHGADDYHLGLNAGLPIYSPVDDEGCLARTADLPEEEQMPDEMVGKSILEKHGESDANRAVIHQLRTTGDLLCHEKYHHSYPHCWRSKTAIIFRAMDQWFVKIDHETDGSTFREKAVAEIDAVKWIPEWGINRIKGAVQSRPDWCISRQRSWGVPIPVLYDDQGEPLLDARIVRRTADLFEKEGSNAWFEKSIEDLWTAVKPEDWTGRDAVKKSTDTLDVWIDSGSSSRAVLKARKNLHHGSDDSANWQADVYLEGSDQHRGWFQSSLLLSLAGNGAAPYKTVLTHGFMVDADREKISKSKQGQGGYDKPQTSEAYVKRWGADIVRLWVSSQDYRNDIVVSEERIKKVAESYRAIRNTLRYQLSNLYDFVPGENTVPDADLDGLECWILGEFSKLQREVAAAYDAYEFHVVYQRITRFVEVELSSIYHDVIKDRMYTDAATSPRRRSSQTALHKMVIGLCEMLSPILAFTADEAWEQIPEKPAASVHLAEWKAIDFPENSEWKRLFDLREIALPALEKARQAKDIGKALEAAVSITAKPDIARFPSAELTSMRELLNVSALDIQGSDDAVEPVVTVRKADGEKCERCWHWETTVGNNADHPTLCDRCVGAVKLCAG
ncbi:MAG: isoleucine--tRNA ligase [Verrucomicrobiae bacterium]|nr:isoleucine--tRNA ligase [Verrucomicrobiae bacterium]